MKKGTIRQLQRVVRTLERMEGVIWNITKSDETLTTSDTISAGRWMNDIAQVKNHIERYIGK
jgi:hypothetical protein